MWRYILRKKMLYGIGFVCVLIGMTVTGVCIKPAKEVQASISYEAVKDIRSDAPGGEEGVSEQPEGENTDDKDDPLDMLGDLSEIEAAVSEAMTVRSSVSFKAILKQLMTGSLSEAGQLLFQMIREQVAGGIYENQQLLFKIACFAVIGAIFTNFAMAFSKEQVGGNRFLSDLYTVNDIDDDVFYDDICHCP